MKNKVIVLFLLCFVLAFAGNGCIGTQYSKEDEQATEELGKKMMQEWLNENMKGEKVSDKGISALAEGLLGGNYYLAAVGKEIINFGSNSRLTVREER
ncbi:MAG: hypothetical protein K6E47_05990 [Lachnospiraceae bacterium]|nr:hypothetical protein [Lachnospiraceae bacterium]